MTGPENRLLVYGNPTRPTGSFYRIAHSDNWSTLRIPASEHPNIISGRDEIPGAVSCDWIAGLAAEYGRSSSIYRSRVEARFPGDAIEGLIRREWLRAAVERYEAMGNETRERREARLLAPPTMALDVSRFGPDKTVLAVMQGPRVIELVTWGEASITETVDRVIEHGRRVAARDIWNRQPTVWVDEPGLGGGAIDVLKAEGYPTSAFNGAKRASDPSRWLNKRAEAFWHFRDVLENGAIELPPDKLLEEEALAVEWQIAPNGAIQIMGKDLLRKALGRSPDRLDAVVIGLAVSLGGMRGPEIRCYSISI